MKPYLEVLTTRGFLSTDWRMIVESVIFDWRGTLVANPTSEAWVARALMLANRPHDDQATAALLKLIKNTAGQPDQLSGPLVDTSAALHRDTYYAVFAEAGFDSDVADALYAGQSDPIYNSFAVDVAETFRSIGESGCKIAILSDIHYDIRPAFENAGLLGYVDSFVLSFENGVQKPDPRIFRLALDQLGTPPEKTLMVGDRASHDGHAVDVGMPTLLVPTLTDVTCRQLHLVLALCACE